MTTRFAFQLVPASSLTDNLPDDMLLEIFHRSDVALVASICQRWRFLALSCSELWNSIHINPLSASSIALGKLHSERSRGCPVNIAFVLSGDGAKKLVTFRLYSNLRNAIDLLMSEVHRIQRFVVDNGLVGSIFSQLPEISYHFPLLRSLTIQYRNGMGVTSILPSNVMVPELKELHISNFPWFKANAFQTDPFLYSSISDLRLSLCSVRSTMVLLVHLNRVEILQLTDIYELDPVFRIDAENMDWGMTGLQDGVLYYPSLRSLTIKVDRPIVQLLFQHTQFPKINYLRIEKKAAQFMEESTIELWRPTLRNVTTLDVSELEIFSELFSGFESVKVVRLLRCGTLSWAEDNIQMLVKYFPKSVDILQLEDEVLWKRA